MQMLQALREALEAVPAASGGGSATEAVREGLVQVGCQMWRHPSALLLQGNLALRRRVQSMTHGATLQSCH